MTLPDLDSLGSFGGALVNFRPVEDPTTDRDAVMMNKALADVGGLTQTAPRAICILTTATTTGALVLVGYRAVWGNATTTPPTLARLATGQFTITQPATVQDELGATHTVAIFGAFANAESTTGYDINAYPTPRLGNVVQVNVFTSSGTATDAAGLNVVVAMY